MKSLVHSVDIDSFSEEQLRAVLQVLQILDTYQYRDYHDAVGGCNAPDDIDLLRKEVEAELSRR
jgi:hypothetical protein